MVKLLAKLRLILLGIVITAVICPAILMAVTSSDQVVDKACLVFVISLYLYGAVLLLGWLLGLLGWLFRLLGWLSRGRQETPPK